MIDSTSVLFGLEDEFVVTSVERLSSEDLRVVIEHRERREVPCPRCGALTSRVKERPLVRVKDLPAGGQRVECGGASVVWRAGSRRVAGGRSCSSPRPSLPGRG